MKFFLTTAAVLAAASPALANSYSNSTSTEHASSSHSNSTVIAPACPTGSTSTVTAITRPPVPVTTPSGPVPSFYTVPTNETASWPSGTGWPGASSSVTWSATATPPMTSQSPEYTGAAVASHPIAFGGVLAAAAGVVGWVL